jgi:hypothetical protein
MYWKEVRLQRQFLFFAIPVVPLQCFCRPNGGTPKMFTWSFTGVIFPFFGDVPVWQQQVTLAVGPMIFGLHAWEHLGRNAVWPLG